MNTTLFVISLMLAGIGVHVFSKSLHSTDAVGVAESLGFMIAGAGFFELSGVM